METETEVVGRQEIEVASVEAISRAEIDMQISTAKKFPRSIAECKRRALSLATISREMAEQCWYSLRRDGKVIEGPSIRLAEIVASTWGNLRIQGLIVGEDAKFVTARGVCHDLETNVAMCVETRRRITRRDGSRYGEDMVMTTANAATSIAVRNAIARTIPRPYIDEILKGAQDVALGEGKTLPQRRKDMLSHFQKHKIGPERIADAVGKGDVDDITLSDIAYLIGVANAIRDGDVKPHEAFPPLEKQRKPGQSKTEALADDLKGEGNGDV